jgi:predicted nucleic acid-binding protein
MKPKVYIETTIISYLAARPSRDLIVAGHQQISHEWWQTSRHSFAVVTSQLVVREAGAGDPEAPEARREFLAGLTLLEITEEAVALAQHLLQAKAIPQELVEDALHVAVAVVNGIEYLLTWNLSTWPMRACAARSKRRVVNSAMRQRSSARPKN